jgi:hypothetical protein
MSMGDLYLGQLKSIPNAVTGEVKVIAPSLSGTVERIAKAKKQYLGIVQPYALNQVVTVEEIEGMLYYSDRHYAIGQHETTNTPESAHMFVTPYGYIAFTADYIEIKHRKGGTLRLDNTLTSNAATFEPVTVSPLDLKFTKWK